MSVGYVVAVPSYRCLRLSHHGIVMINFMIKNFSSQISNNSTLKLDLPESRNRH